MIIGCRILSSFLACRISTIPRIWGGDIQCVFSLGLGKRCAFSFPDQPRIWCLRRRIGEVIFCGFNEGISSKSFLVGLHRSDC